MAKRKTYKRKRNRLPIPNSLSDLALPRHAGPSFRIDPYTALEQQSIAAGKFSADLDDILARYVPRHEIESKYIPIDKVRAELIPKSDIPIIERRAFHSGIKYGAPLAVSKIIGYELELADPKFHNKKFGDNAGDVLSNYSGYMGEKPGKYYFPKLETVADFAIDSEFAQAIDTKRKGQFLAQSSMKTLLTKGFDASGVFDDPDKEFVLKKPQLMLHAKSFELPVKTKPDENVFSPYDTVMNKLKADAQSVSADYISKNGRADYIFDIGGSKQTGIKKYIENYQFNVSYSNPDAAFAGLLNMAEAHELIPAKPIKKVVQQQQLLAIAPPAPMAIAPPAPMAQQLPNIGIIPAAPALQPAPPAAQPAKKGLDFQALLAKEEQQ